MNHTVKLYRIVKSYVSYNTWTCGFKIGIFLIKICVLFKSNKLLDLFSTKKKKKQKQKQVVRLAFNTKLLIYFFFFFFFEK